MSERWSNSRKFSNGDEYYFLQPVPTPGDARLVFKPGAAKEVALVEYDPSRYYAFNKANSRIGDYGTLEEAKAACEAVEHDA